jgi:hypothetical protein
MTLIWRFKVTEGQTDYSMLTAELNSFKTELRTHFFPDPTWATGYIYIIFCSLRTSAIMSALN